MRPTCARRENGVRITKEKLCNMLKQAGFSNAYVSAYGQSHAPVMRNVLYFDYRRPNMSLYVEAVK